MSAKQILFSIINFKRCNTIRLNKFNCGISFFTQSPRSYTIRHFNHRSKLATFSSQLMMVPSCLTKYSLILLLMILLKVLPLFSKFSAIAASTLPKCISFPASDNHRLDVNQKEFRVHIYANRLTNIIVPNTTDESPQFVVAVTNPSFVTFSASSVLKLYRSPCFALILSKIFKDSSSFS